jgi:exonuclease I
LQAAVLEAIPAEKIVRHLSPEQLEASLTEEQAARLRELLERHRAR